ncbi:MAG: phage holin [Oscillospiraceae bacterium]
MKINWKVRLKSGPFWMGVISAVVIAVFAVLDLFGVVTDVSAEQILRVATLILMVPAAIGIISDPTTAGVSDSTQAMTYEKPKEDK